jgi:hypothetical protein
MRRRMVLAAVVVAFGVPRVARARGEDDGDLGADPRRQGETWEDYYARRQRRVERDYPGLRWGNRDRARATHR